MQESRNHLCHSPFSFSSEEKKGSFFPFERTQFLLVLLTFFSFSVNAQKIKSSGYDAAKKHWVIESFPVPLKSSPQGRMDVLLRSYGDSISLQLTGSGIGANTVIAGDALIFLLDNDSTITVQSPSVQRSDRNNYKHEYDMPADALESLSRHNLQALRKYSTEGYDDVYLDKQNTAKLKELSNTFLEEMNKAALFKTKPSSAQPGFPGGKDVMLRFLNRNLKPLPPLQAGERKFILAEFMVAADGSINDLAIKYPAGDAFDKETLRILKRMPKWKPAVHGSNQVDAIVRQPLTLVQTSEGMKIFF